MSDPMDLAKLAVDVGLMTNDWPSHQQLLAEVGVEYDHLLKIGRGVHQHRYAIGDSVLKVNSHRDELVATPSPLVGLRVAGAVDRPTARVTADRVPIDIVPVGTDGIVDVEVRWRTHRPDEVAEFLEAGLGGVQEEERWRVGTSWFVVEADPAAPEASEGLDGLGLRYLTVQVRNVVREHARLVDLGYESAREPVRLGDTACISFVRAPDGVWVEVSQRASLTGALPVLH
ncbi:VOC family protein [Ilumatobacter sp.]|uniref:VOC family protein n=1 Tax=Ilumatobacter sp. TaxID=1967498 RepID=UPI003C54048A